MMIVSYEYLAESIVASTFTKHMVKYPLLIHQQMEFVYITKGYAVCTIDGHKETLRAGDMGIVFSHVPHEYEFSDCEFYMIMFSPAICSDYYNELNSVKPEYPFIKDCANDELSYLLLKAHSSYRNKTEIGYKISKGYLNALVGETLQRLTMVPHKNENTALSAKIFMYCSENYKNDITVESLSKAIGISTKYCSKVIKTLLKQNFREYINTLRMFEATKLLKSSEYPITYIALEVGYKNQSTFNRVFINRFGITPKQFRAEQANK